MTRKLRASSKQKVVIPLNKKSGSHLNKDSIRFSNEHLALVLNGQVLALTKASAAKGYEEANFNFSQESFIYLVKKIKPENT